jgi:hypothetical protein
MMQSCTDFVTMVNIIVLNVMSILTEALAVTTWLWRDEEDDRDEDDNDLDIGDHEGDEEDLKFSKIQLGRA